MAKIWPQIQIFYKKLSLDLNEHFDILLVKIYHLSDFYKIELI